MRNTAIYVLAATLFLPGVAAGSGSRAGDAQKPVADEAKKPPADDANGAGTEDRPATVGKKWKFAWFFNRVKAQVAQHWHPEEAYQRTHPSNPVNERKNRYTLLRIQMKRDGTLASLSVQEPSGLEPLDDEAMTAFKRAEPFPNPPSELFREGNVITFGIGFLFDAKAAHKMHFFLYSDDH